MDDRIRVVTAVIIRDGRVLLTQRDPLRSAHYSLMWESPGGKVDPGEAAEDALRREIVEEIGCYSVIRSKLLTLDLDPGGDIHVERPLSVTLYDVDIGYANPQPLQSIGLGWFTATDVLHLDLLPANDAYRGELAARLVREGRHHG